MNKLEIGHEMAELDRKQRRFYQDLIPEERRKFSTYLMIRWASAVQGSRDLQEFYVIATNERLNKHFFSVNRHPALQWLMATSVSPGMGVHRHSWIAPKKRSANGGGAMRKQLQSLLPNLRDDELDLLIQINDRKDLARYLDDHGVDSK
jgi:hypothetical protein